VGRAGQRRDFRRLPTIGPVGNGGGAVLGFGADAGSSFDRADLSGANLGANGNLSSAIVRRTAAVTAASSSSVSSTFGMGLVSNAASARATRITTPD